jgi:GNAT superfamily N-acetyltransferase
MPDFAAPGLAMRAAALADAAVIARHRTLMFADMGLLPEATHADMQQITEAYLVEALPRGEYLGWLVHLAGAPEQVIAGAGVQRRRGLPHPSVAPTGDVSVAFGRHAIVLNVYTEAAWRRRGIAETLMRVVIDWARANQIDKLVLHASVAGQPLYHRLGFSRTNEMQFHEMETAPE